MQYRMSDSSMLYGFLILIAMGFGGLATVWLLARWLFL
jgi:hypothetical protein